MHISDKNINNEDGMMSEATSGSPAKTNTIIDLFYGTGEGNDLQIDVAIKEDGRCAVFYNKPLKDDLSWFEYDLDHSKLSFVTHDGESRDIGIPIKKEMSKNMQNSHQILMVLMDDQTGSPKEGTYVPLILHSEH